MTASATQPIKGIRPVAPEVSLRTSGATSLPAGTNWDSGISWRSAGCVVGHPWAGICSKPADVDAEKVVAPSIAEIAFRPVTFYVPWSCDWVTDDQVDEVRGDALAQLEAVTDWHLSRELWAGSANLREVDSGNLNPTLMSEAADLTVGDHPVHAVYAIGDLLANHADCAQAGGAVLHVPIVLIPFLTNQGVIKRVGDRLLGPMDTPVSPGPGYPGPGPWGPDGDVAPPGSVWVYVTGPVEYDLTAPKVMPDDQQARWDRRRNRYELVAERRAIVRFDPCCIFALNVDVPNAGSEAS